MRDIERLLREALQRQGEDYEPSDPQGARAAFVERLRRRRRLLYLRTGGAVAAVALIAAVVLMPGPLTEPGPDVDLASVTPEVVATIPVGGAPSSSSPASDGAVWVATGDEVVAIDPEVNGVVMNARTTGRSDEVAAGDDHVWVATTEGQISMVSPQSGSVLARTSVPRPQPLDIAASGASLWAVGINDGSLYETSASPQGFDDGAKGAEATEDGEGSAEDDGLVIFEQNFLNMPLTDVAVGDAGLWVLFRDGDSAGVFLVDPEDITGGGTPIPVEVGNSSDLAVGLHAVWLATGDKGTVERIDPRTGEITASVEVGGRYTDLAVGEGVVWAVTGGDGPSRLYQIGADGEFIGEPLELEGDPVDVAVGAGAVWVADQEQADVLRIEPQSRDEMSTPDLTPTPTSDPMLDPSDILYVYSAGGDLYGHLLDGSSALIVDAPQLDKWPAFDPSGAQVAIRQELSDEDRDLECADLDLPSDDCLWDGVAVIDLADDQTSTIGEQGWPAFSPTGDLASLSPDGRLAISRHDRSGATAPQIDFPPGVDEIRNLHWSVDGNEVFFEARGVVWATYRLELPPDLDSDFPEFVELTPEVIVPAGLPTGAEVVASASASVEGIDVLVLCCGASDNDHREYAALGRVTFTKQGADYEEIRRFLPPLLELDTDEYYLENLGSWFFEDAGGWIERPEGTSWLIGDGLGLAVVGDEDGQDSYVERSGHGPAAEYRGFAANPALVSTEDLN